MDLKAGLIVFGLVLLTILAATAVAGGIVLGIGLQDQNGDYVLAGVVMLGVGLLPFAVVGTVLLVWIPFPLIAYCRNVMAYRRYLRHHKDNVKGCYLQFENGSFKHLDQSSNAGYYTFVNHGLERFVS